MNIYIPKYRTNSYNDRMTCTYFPIPSCGTILFGNKTLNIYTPTIPPRIDYTYLYNIYPNDYPYIYYYGSYKNRLINY